MNYRALGNTGLRVSEIGIGCEGFCEADKALSDQLMRKAIDSGINIMDLYTPDPDVQTRIGESVSGIRERFVLQVHLCTKWNNGQYVCIRDLNSVKDSFEKRLLQLNTDYVDIGMIHYVDSLATWKTIQSEGIMEYALQEKKKGRIRHVGLSSHNPHIAKMAVETGLIEVLMFSVNPCYDLLPASENVEDLWTDDNYEKPLFSLDAEREALYELCQNRGVGITVMKAFGGGDLLSDTDSPAKKSMTPVQCIHYALTRPAVASVMSGVRSLSDLEGSLAYESATEAEKDYASVFASFPKISWEGHCMYCGHCAPCPKGIPVADVTKFLHLTRGQGFIPETVAQHYSALRSHAGDCIGCGACETRCPFHVKIIENMRKAEDVFGY